MVVLSDRLRQWGSALVVAAAVLVGFALTVDWAPIEWYDAILLGVVLVPAVALWLWAGSSYFSIATWLLPALLFIGLVWVLAGDSRAFGLLVTGVGFVVWSFGCTERGNQVWGRWYTRVGTPLLRAALPKPDRAAHRALMGIIDEYARQSSPTERDVTARISALRAGAERLEQMSAPDDRWASVIRLHLDLFVTYAEVLEGRRSHDPDGWARAVKERDEALARLLRARSPVYRLMELSLRKQQKSVVPEGGPAIPGG